MGFERFQNKVAVTGWFTAETAMRIGAGTSLSPVGTDNPVVRNAYGKPYIPGSSFKGILRSTVERLARSLRGPSAACNPVNENEWCVRIDDVKHFRRELRDSNVPLETADEKFTEKLLAKTCDVCKVFGSPFVASKVLIKDLDVDESYWDERLFEVRDGVAIDRETETVASGRKFDYEVVPAGTPFKVEIATENVTDDELALLFLGLREMETGSARLGGGKSRGLGKMTLRITEITAVDATKRNELLGYLKTGRAPKVENIRGFIDEKVNTYLAKLGG